MLEKTRNLFNNQLVVEASILDSEQQDSCFSYAVGLFFSKVEPLFLISKDIYNDKSVFKDTFTNKELTPDEVGIFVKDSGDSTTIVINGFSIIDGSDHVYLFVHPKADVANFKLPLSYHYSFNRVCSYVIKESEKNSGIILKGFGVDSFDYVPEDINQLLTGLQSMHTIELPVLV